MYGPVGDQRTSIRIPKESEMEKNTVSEMENWLYVRK